MKMNLEKLNQNIGRMIAGLGDWCEEHVEQIEFFGTHVVLPAAVGIMASRLTEPTFITNVYVTPPADADCVDATVEFD